MSQPYKPICENCGAELSEEQNDHGPCFPYKPERKWILIPKSYQPDSKESREECGMEYVKYYSQAAYEELEREVERLTGVAYTWQQSALNSECEIITLRQKLANVEIENAELESPTMVNGKREIIRLNKENAQLRERVRELEAKLSEWSWRK